MKNLIKKLTLHFAIIMLSVPFMYSDCKCNKSDFIDTTPYMNWVYQSNFISANSDTAFLSAGTIDGYFNGTPSTLKQHVEVSLQGSNLAIGTYGVGGGPNSVYIWLGTNSAIGARSGHVDINALTPDWVSGTFDVVLSNGLPLTGTMYHVPID